VVFVHQDFIVQQKQSLGSKIRVSLERTAFNHYRKKKTHVYLAERAIHVQIMVHQMIMSPVKLDITAQKETQIRQRIFVSKVNIAQQEVLITHPLVPVQVKQH